MLKHVTQKHTSVVDAFVDRCHRSSGSYSPSTAASSTLRIYAKSVVKDLEYITLNVGAQEKCCNVIKLLLKKYRLKNCDFNLYYLTLERWIRNDGLRQKSVMLLGDNACPVQLQQCCSNPPYDDIKITLQTKPAILVQVYTEELVADSKYKYFSLSSQTTVGQAIELLLTSLSIKHSDNCSSNYNCDMNNNDRFCYRQANSPLSTCSSISSSSSGFASEDFFMSNCETASQYTQTANCCTLVADSNSNSNQQQSAVSSSFELIVENKSLNYRRQLHDDEILADVYQGLSCKSVDDFKHNHNRCEPASLQRHQPQPEFKIKIVKKQPIERNFDSNDIEEDDALEAVNFRRKLSLQTQHLLPVLSADKLLAARRQLKPTLSMPVCRTSSATPTNLFLPPKSMLERTCSQQSLPALTQLPAVLPRTRNSLPSALKLINTDTGDNSITFGSKPKALSHFNRRRYDPTQLALDIERLTTIDETSPVNNCS